jgi:hypothetical protein
LVNQLHGRPFGALEHLYPEVDRLIGVKDTGIWEAVEATPPSRAHPVLAAHSG